MLPLSVKDRLTRWYTELLTETKTVMIAAHTILKNAKNAPLDHNLNSSSNECSSSSTTPNTAINTAPNVTNAVPTTALDPNVSPNINLANKALKIKETAPRGARMTIGRASSWNMVEKMLEKM